MKDFQWKHFFLVALFWLAGVGTAAAATVTNVMMDTTFVPATRNINVGDTVVWVNQDQDDHTTSGWPTNSPDETFCGFSTISGFGGTCTYTFNTAGSYGYFCAIHEGMVGRVVVGGGTNPPAVLQPPVRIGNNQFRLTIVGTAGKTYTTEASTNLTNWNAVATNVAPANTFNVTDATATNVLRFYRARE